MATVRSLQTKILGPRLNLTTHLTEWGYRIFRPSKTFVENKNHIYILIINQGISTTTVRFCLRLKMMDLHEINYYAILKIVYKYAFNLNMIVLINVAFSSLIPHYGVAILLFF